MRRHSAYSALRGGCVIKGKINPLNVLDIRKLDFCPPYFETTTFAMKYNITSAMEEWITSNCNGRYFIGRSVQLVNDQITPSLKVGFESPSELSYFLLACPHLKYN